MKSLRERPKLSGSKGAAGRATQLDHSSYRFVMLMRGWRMSAENGVIRCKAMKEEYKS